MRWFEDANTHQQRGGDRDDGLYVIIDRDHRWTQGSLTNHREDIAQERADTDDISHFPPGFGGDGLRHHLSDMQEGKGQQHQRSPREHILIDRKDVVSSYQRIEERQIECKRELCKQTEQVASDVANLAIRMGSTRQNQYQRTAATHHHTQCLLTRDRLFQDQGRQQHRKNRHRGGDNRGVDGRGDAQTDGVATLVTKESEDSCSYEHQFVATRHFFLGSKARGYPEQQTGSHHSEGNHCNAIDAMRHCIFADRRHQAPASTRSEHREVGYQRTIFILSFHTFS